MREVNLRVKNHFYASHQLKSYNGKCRNLHGHSFNVEINARGNKFKNNMLIDFSKLKDIIDELDHGHLNDTLGEDDPTAEYIAEYLINRLEALYPEVKFKVVVWESPNASAGVVTDGYY